ncbi:uncharacterized protein LOC128741044 [Sabethes cyaneus]|uniref:uncharacterized protein LOC128741044 n=1 Tax=Sabethes cyaneus TaxID=53552 RepID=UPI00237D5BCE|nr:uncharacterized protein LOC128741044 [Sabethes cyaneus]
MQAIHGNSFSSILHWATVSLIILLALVADRSYATDDHVCIRYESYTELETVPRNQTVQVLTREWCLEIPPRCTSYRPEIKEVYVKQNITKTRKIEYCCEGYEENSTNGSASTNRICRPLCRGGCGRGTCVAPNSCLCEAGFTGKHCTQRCRNGTWGESCRSRCHCQNQALCDGKTGHCRCSDGWIGHHCEAPCPAGHYGTLCKNRCNCSTSRCDHITGTCLIDDGHVMFENITRVVESNMSGESTERISVEQWIKVNSTISSTVNSIDSTTTELNEPIPSNATYAQSYNEYLPANASVTYVPIEDLTSTTETAKNESYYEIVATTTKVEITFIDTVHSRTEGNSTSDTNSNELVYVESDNQSNVVELVDGKEVSNEEQQINNKQAIATISCLLLTLILLLSVVAYMKNLNRKTMKKQQHQQPVKSLEEEKGPDSPRILEPLPDPPRVIYTKVKAKNQRTGSNQLEHYDVPVNNSSVNKSSPYNYNFTLAGSKPPQQNSPARRYSIEHIYDEIQYPPFADMSVNVAASAGENGSRENFSKFEILTDYKMTPVKVIDEIKGKQ